MTIFLNSTPKTIISVNQTAIKKSGRLPAFTLFDKCCKTHASMNNHAARKKSNTLF